MVLALAVQQQLALPETWLVRLVLEEVAVSRLPFPRTVFVSAEPEARQEAYFSSFPP